jgi:threonine dehydrogenase-like Zn-dependent dehydrogenase
MKSAWIVQREKIEFREEECAPPAADEVVVRVRTCGICGTDLHFYRDLPGNVPTPLGHEVAGTIYQVGEAVADLHPDQEVIVQNHVSCGRCAPCLMGRPALCRDIHTYMNDRAALAEYLRVPASMVVPYTSLSHEEAALAEPLTVAFDLFRRAGIEPFQNVCVSGPGIIGLFCTKLAVDSGAGSVVVLGKGLETERGRRRKEAALQLGADTVVDTDRKDWIELVKAEVPEGFEKIIVTSPPRSIPPTFELAAFGGKIIFNGISFRDEEITFNANSFHFKKLSLIASHAIPNWGFPQALQMLAEMKPECRQLITHRFPFEQIHEAFRIAGSKDHGVIKVMVNLK